MLDSMSRWAWGSIDHFLAPALGTTTMAGELVAAAIAEGDDRYKLFAPFGLDWTGGPLGLAAVEATYRWYRFRDWLRG
jgi:gamma-glutamylputrescine oxidase